MATTGIGIDRRLSAYEGLIFSTAQRLVGRIDHMDQADIEQELRVKVWRALRAFNPAHRRRGEAVDAFEKRYVFMCVTDRVKDLTTKRARRGELHIEDFCSDSPLEGAHSQREWFEGRFMVTTVEEVFREVEDEGVPLPELTDTELQAVCLLYEGYRQTEVAGQLGLTKYEMERTIRSIRDKLHALRPGAGVADIIRLQAATAVGPSMIDDILGLEAAA